RHFSYSLDDALAEQALRANEQEHEREHIGEPVLDAAAGEIEGADEDGGKKHLRELFARADDQSADDRARDRGETAEDKHRQRLERDERQRELHAELGAPHHPRDQRDEPRYRPHHQPDAIERDADGFRGLLVVGDGPQRPADPSYLKEDRQRQHHYGADGRGNELGRIDQQPAGKDRLQNEDRIRRQPQPDLVDVAAPEALPEAFEKVRDPERGHEQDDSFLVDQAAQDQEFDRIGERNHDQNGEGEGEDQRHELGQPRKRQRRKQHHRPLREVEHPRSFEDQYEAERHERVEHPGHEAADQRLEEGAKHRDLNDS